jgi:chromosome segregation ATPase
MSAISANASSSYQTPDLYISNLESTVIQLSAEISRSNDRFQTAQERGKSFNFQEHIVQPFTFIFNTLKSDINIVHENILSLTGKLHKLTKDKDTTIQFLSEEYNRLGKAYEELFIRFDMLSEDKQKLKESLDSATQELELVQLENTQLSKSLKEEQLVSLERSKEINELYNNQSGLTGEFEKKNEAIHNLKKREKALIDEISTLKEKLAIEENKVSITDTLRTTLKEKDTSISKLKEEKSKLSKEILKKDTKLYQYQAIFTFLSTVSLVSGAAYLALNQKNLLNG